MKIGGAWTRKSEKTGKMFLSISLDKEFLELCPQLKNCNLMVNYISPEERKSEKSPGWSVNLIKNDDYDKNKIVQEAEQVIQQENTMVQTSETSPEEEGIPL